MISPTINRHQIFKNFPGKGDPFHCFPYEYKAVTITDETKDKEIGYIVAAYIPEKTWLDLENNPLLFLTRFEGAYFYNPYKDKSWNEPLVPNFKDILPFLYKKKIIDDLSGYQQLDEKILLKLLSGWQTQLKKDKEIQKQFKSYKELAVDKPFVDFIRVNPEYQRKGFSYQLYEAMAIWLFESNLFLHSSRIQSIEAKFCWDRMKENGWVEEDILNTEKNKEKKQRWKLSRHPAILKVENVKKPSPAFKL